MKRLIAVMMLCLVPAICSSGTFQGLSYTTSGDVVVGKWTAQFAKAKTKAKSGNIPLVAIWVSPSCGYCQRLGSALAASSVSTWASKRGYVFVIGVLDETSEASSVRSFAHSSSGKYPFVGIWWPRKSGGELKKTFSGRSGTMPVTSGTLAQQFMNSVDASVGDYAGVDTPKTKQYVVSVTSSPSGGGRIAGTGSYASGDTVKLTATPTTGYVLAGWYSGTTLLTQEKSYSFKMGSSAKTLTAKFIKKGDDKVVLGSFKTKDEYRTGVEIEPIVLSATGGSLPTIKVTPLPSGLKFTTVAREECSANSIYGTPTKSGIYSLQVSASTAGGAKASAIMKMLVRRATERLVSVDCDSAQGKVSGAGIFADGKTARVKATAASGHCFTGWTLNGNLLSRSASYAYPVAGRDVTLVAGFVTKEADLASISLALGGKAQSVSSVQTNVVQCGVAMNLTVVARADSGAAVSASGLPSGLKLVKTLVNKELNEYAYVISGVPSSPSKVDTKTGLPKPTVTKITVTSQGKNKKVYTIAFVVNALPTWAYGTFAGSAVANEEGAGVGAASMTVSSAGKISGKFALYGTNWTFSATGYTNYVNSSKTDKIRYRMQCVAKASRLTRNFVAEVRDGLLQCSIVEGEGDELLLELHRKVWSDKPALPSPKLSKTYLDALGYTNKLSVAVSSSGTATFAGKLNDGTKVSSSTLVYIDAKGDYKADLIVPATKKYSGYFDEITISDLFQSK